MALKQLGSSYLVGNSTGGSTVNDGDLWHRGWKDFLFWIDYSHPGVTQQIVIKAGNGDDKNPHYLNAYVYECANLLDDPGTQKGSTSRLDIPADQKVRNPVSLTVAAPQTTTPKLFRLRVETDTIKPIYNVDFQNISWVSMETWEPRFNFYCFGMSSRSPVKQYFFVPKLPPGETVRARLQIESKTEKARLDVYTETGTTPLQTAIVQGEHEPIGGFPPYFNTLELSGDDLPEEAPGAIYRFELTFPTRNKVGKLVISENQCSGNTWVRFSRNVPPYFSSNPNRLIYPIVHREFEPVVYTSVSGSPPKRQTYRAYLTVPRGQAGTPSKGKLRVEIDGTVAFAEGSDYTAAVSYASPPKRTKLSDAEVYAQLFEKNNLIADSTDKVDEIFVVPAPDYDEDWPDMMLVAYDNGNGSAVNSPILKAAHFNVIQTNTETTLSIIDDDDTKAMGVLYSGNLSKWFNEAPGNPNDPRVLFWALQDEPDSGPGIQINKEGNPCIAPMTCLKAIYEGMYDYKGKTSTKPCSLNLMLPIFIEEYSKGCDIISSDPYVRPSTGVDQARITDCAVEMDLHSFGKKTLIILWWWDPKTPISTAICKDTFAGSFNAANNAEVDGIGGWNFAGSQGRLNQDTDLWGEITAKNDSV